MDAYKVSVKTILFFAIYFISCFTIKSQPYDNRFPLYKMGIKVQKEGNYFLLTPEKIKELKDSYYRLIDVCEDSKLALDMAIKNPNYQVLINEYNYNEIITFIKFPQFPFDKDFPEFLQNKLRENCYSIKDSKIENLSLSEGKSNIGNYVCLLNKITRPEISYYSEAYFFETRNATITMTINSIAKISNIDFINSIEYINNENYDELIDEYKELIWKDDYTGAKAKLSVAINSEPNNILAYERRASLNLKIKNNIEAINEANEALKIDATNINATIIKGLALYNQNKYEEAIKCFKDAQNYFSLEEFLNIQNEYFYSFADMYRVIGEAYIHLKNPTSAREYLESALKLSYDSLNTASIYYNLGLTNETLLKKSIDAIKFYSLAIENYPISAPNNKAEAYYNRGLSKRFNNDLKGAIEDYTLSINVRPDYVKPYNNRGYAKLELEDYQGAIIDFNFAIQFDNYKTELTKYALGNRGIAKLSVYQDGCPDLKKAIDLGNVGVKPTYDEYCK